MGLIESWIKKALSSRLNKVMDFYQGEVVLQKQGLKYSTYRIIENNSTIDVHVAAHVRLVLFQFILPPTFTILAPMKYVKVVSGNVPEHQIFQMTVREYTIIRNMHNVR